MATRTEIDPSLPVIEIVRRHPEARAILARYGVDTCCGGAHPLRMAAVAHNVPLEPILEEIERAVEAAGTAAAPSDGAPRSADAPPRRGLAVLPSSAGESATTPPAAEPGTPDALVTAGMSVRDIMARWPRTALVFGRHGLMGCGGAEGPDEPVGWFAKVHNVEVERLLAELNDAARGMRLPVLSEAPAAEPPVIYRPFIKTAFLFTFTGGTTLGVVALVLMALQGRLGSISAALVQSHGHVQLYGWVAIFIMGVAYHILPRLKGADLPGTFLPKLSLAAMTAGVILRGAAQAAEMGRTSRVLFFLGGNLEVLAVLLFISLCAPLLMQDRSRERFERFLTAGNIFLALATLMQASAVGALAALDSMAVPAWLESPFLAIFLLGFVGFWILGVSVRTLPVFMGLRATSKGGLTFAFWALAAGVPVWAAAQGLLLAGGGSAARALMAAGAALTGAGLLVFPAALRVFAKPEPAGPGMEADRGFEKFIRASYGWLVASALMLLGISAAWAWTGEPVPHAYVGAFRHALTVGFVTLMMVGMGSRIIPIFSGAPLRSAAARDAAFWLIMTGCAIRVVFQALSEPFGPAFLRVSGVSGLLELTGMVLFAWNVWGALAARRKARPRPAGGAPPIGGGGERRNAGREPLPILPETSVGRLLEERPDMLEVFVTSGFVQLANPILRSTFARFVSIERACRMHRVDVDLLLGRLRAAAPASR